MIFEKPKFYFSPMDNCSFHVGFDPSTVDVRTDLSLMEIDI